MKYLAIIAVLLFLIIGVFLNGAKTGTQNPENQETTRSNPPDSINSAIDKMTSK